MFGSMDLRLIHQHQETLRREADERRVAARIVAKDGKHPGRTFRVPRLRLSVAA